MEYEIKPKNKLTLGISELWKYRELFYFFTWRDIKVKYKQTVLGFLWAIIQPLALTILFQYSLGKIIADNSQLSLPYPIFAFSGLILWNIFSSGISSAGNSMVSNANIIKKIYFPRLIIPISSILVALFDFLMSFAIFIAFLFYYNISINWVTFIIVTPFCLFITITATMGIGCWLAALNIKYRDFRYVIPFFIQTLLFLTPVIYPASLIENVALKRILPLNPMNAPIELFRYALNSSQLDTTVISISLGSNILLLAIGLFYFRKTESYFADLA